MKSYGLHLQDYANDCWVYVEYVDDSRVYVDDCRVYAVYSVKNALVTNKRSACSLDDMNTWTSVSRLHSADLWLTASTYRDWTGLLITLIILFLVSHFNFVFIPCGRLSWLTVSFLLHVKYTLSYRIVCLACEQCNTALHTSPVCQAACNQLHIDIQLLACRHKDLSPRIYFDAPGLL